MDEGLEVEWSKLKLMEAEEEVMIFDEEVSAEKKEEIELSILGQLLTQSNYNIRVMKNVLRNIWWPSKGKVVRELDHNIVVFQFSSKKDKEHVLNEGP